MALSLLLFTAQCQPLKLRLHIQQEKTDLLLGREGKLLAPSHTTPVACFLSPALPSNTALHSSQTWSKITRQPSRSRKQRVAEKEEEKVDEEKQKVEKLIPTLILFMVTTVIKMMMILVVVVRLKVMTRRTEGEEVNADSNTAVSYTHLRAHET